MSGIRRLIIVKRKFGLALTLLFSILLIFGCVIVFLADNFISFIFTLIIPTLLVLNLILGIYWLFRSNNIFLFSLLGIILYFFCFDSFIQFNSILPSQLNKTALKLNTLSILSYNTHGFKQDDDIDGEKGIDEQIVNFIHKRNPDILCIQEFSAIKYKLFGNYPYWFKTNISTRNKSVMAIFSKYPIKDKAYINFPNSSNGAMYVDIFYDNEVIRIYNFHLESYRTDAMDHLNNPKSYSTLIKRIGNAEIRREEQAILVKNHINEFDGKVIVCGDLNSTQFSSSYNILKDSRKDSFIEAGSGFGSTYKLFNYPFRLDYVLVDDSFNVLSHQNFVLKISDHEPVLVHLKLK